MFFIKTDVYMYVSPSAFCFTVELLLFLKHLIKIVTRCDSDSKSVLQTIRDMYSKKLSAEDILWFVNRLQTQKQTIYQRKISSTVTKPSYQWSKTYVKGRTNVASNRLKDSCWPSRGTRDHWSSHWSWISNGTRETSALPIQSSCC